MPMTSSKRADEKMSNRKLSAVIAKLNEPHWSFILSHKDHQVLILFLSYRNTQKSFQNSSNMTGYFAEWTKCEIYVHRLGLASPSFLTHAITYFSSVSDQRQTNSSIWMIEVSESSMVKKVFSEWWLTWITVKLSNVIEGHSHRILNRNSLWA